MLLALAIIPGLIFLFMVWRLDKVEKEPLNLLLFLLAMGSFSTVPAMLLETGFEIVHSSLMEPGTTAYLLIENFLGVALIEELCKYFFLKRFTWKSREFNYLFDGIVYSVCVGIGFAILENILYVIDGGIETAIYRALLAIPGHGVYAIMMGHYYSMARFQLNRGNKRLCKKWLRRALLIPILCHGLYDFCLSSDNILLILAVLGFTIYLYIINYKNVKKHSKLDSKIVIPTAADYLTGNATAEEYLAAEAIKDNN